MVSRYPSPLVPLDMLSLLRNLYDAKANIQMQKTGAEGWFVSSNSCPLLIWSVGQRVRAALPADIDSMAGTAGSLNLRIWADQGMQARATGPRHMAVRGSRLRYACRPMGNDPPESHHNQGHPDLHARSTVHTRRSEVASGGFTEPPTL
jgi:hypothetical protein